MQTKKWCKRVHLVTPSLWNSEIHEKFYTRQNAIGRYKLKKNGEPRGGGGSGSTLCCSITQSRIEPSPYITNKVRQTIEISK